MNMRYVAHYDRAKYANLGLEFVYYLANLIQLGKIDTFQQEKILDVGIQLETNRKIDTLQSPVLRLSNGSNSARLIGHLQEDKTIDAPYVELIIATAS